MKAKYINENNIEPAPPFIIVGEKVIANPTDDILAELGYKEVIEAEYPETADGYYRVPIYEDGDKIVQKWSDKIKIEEWEKEAKEMSTNAT